MKNSYTQIYFLVAIFFTSSIATKAQLEKDFYIAFLEERDVGREESLLKQAHLDILISLKGSEDDAKESLVYSYTKSFNAFAAKLYKHEVSRLSGMDNVLSVVQNKYHKPYTTKSWDFIGLSQTSKRRLHVERDIIVGIIDTGIIPESESFNDHGLGPPPIKWKGICQKSANFSGCNNKLIGARYFNKADSGHISSPIDLEGHGTHVSSTVAGTLVPNASLSGLAKGTARGAVPSARIAMYKVCWGQGLSMGCSYMDILAAFEAAIDDGVDVISISIGPTSPVSFDMDMLAIGSFHAMRNGILTVAAGGNSGPSYGSISNYAPWLLTVAASGISRQFESKVMLGNGQTILGVAVSLFEPKQKLYPLATGADLAKNAANKENASYCMEDSMDAKKVKGKIVLCKSSYSSRRGDSLIKGLGGIGIIIESETDDYANVFMVPSTVVNYTTGEMITKYIRTTRTPSAVIYKSEETKIPAPFIASFSSRGPPQGLKHLLKPDIAAPGVDILAAYTPLNSLSGQIGDNQRSKFNLMSGTSMACPHVGGTAAYVKSFHPTWSPAAIKSAIMTTATPMRSKVNPESEFAYGAGQLNPRKAISPGLVYDMDEMAYLQFLCHEGYSESSFGQFIGRKSINCSNWISAGGEDAINYPTMQLILNSEKEHRTGVFRRTVTNVGPAMSVYNATIEAPKGIEISVSPTSLSFTRVSQKRSFTVVVKAKSMPNAKIIVSGSLMWKSPDGLLVRSPIVVYNIQGL